MTGSRTRQNHPASPSQSRDLPAPNPSDFAWNVQPTTPEDSSATSTTYRSSVKDGFVSSSRLVSQDQYLETPGAISTSDHNTRVASTTDEQALERPGDDTFLGSTAFNAPFTENQGEVPSSDESDTSPEFGQKLHEQITARQLGNYHLDSRMKEAMNVMRFLKQFPSLKGLLVDADKMTPECGILSEWVKTATKTIHDDVWMTGKLENESTMSETVKQIFKATAQPVNLGSSTRFGDVMQHFSGVNLRWETLAMFLTVCGLCLCTQSSQVDSLKFVGNTEEARQELMYRLHESSNACISFCDELGCTNEIYLATLIESSVYASQVLGDTHHVVWRKLGEMSNAVFAIGLHSPDRAKRLPFWLRELRIRCFGLAYSLDKTVSCFLGRPPRIAKRYCQIEIPLDLAWVELAEDEVALAETIRLIGADGWSRQRSRRGEREWMYLRPFVLNALIREDVLEICLGPPKSDLREVALEIIERNDQTYRNMPHFLTHQPGQWVEHPPSQLQGHLFVDFNYNKFLVTRTMVRHLGEGNEDMLQVAQQILQGVIEIHHLRRRASVSNFETQWHAAFYGLPTAGVLAMELLQQKSKDLCHSWVAQLLCVFISILRWLHTPGDGNYKLIDRARRSLQSIMDKYLGVLHKNTPFPISKRMPAGVSDMSPPLTDSLLLAGQEGYDFTWLDNGMFDQSFWAELEPHDIMVD